MQIVGRVAKCVRKLIELNDPRHIPAGYILAVMLERKRVLKQIKTDQSGDRPVLIYEHGKSGDVFIVPDVRLRLDELVEELVILSPAEPPSYIVRLYP